jgi:hypothetical protein
VITLNVDEADDVQREKRRVSMHEPYRTLLGHFRHEVGHYYWDRLIKFSPRIEGFRALFGDERVDYNGALKIYYDKGPRRIGTSGLSVRMRARIRGRIGRRRGRIICT